MRAAQAKLDIEIDKKMAKAKFRADNIAASMESLTGGKKKMAKEIGEWKVDEYRHWEWHARTTQISIAEKASSVHAESCSMIRRLKAKNDRAVYDARWRELTAGKGEIEIPWTRSAPFDVDNIGEEEVSVVKDASLSGSAIEEDLNFCDENDAELEGVEDLAELMEAMGGGSGPDPGGKSRK